MSMGLEGYFATQYTTESFQLWEAAQQLFQGSTIVDPPSLAAPSSDAYLLLNLSVQSLKKLFQFNPIEPKGFRLE